MREKGSSKLFKTYMAVLCVIFAFEILVLVYVLTNSIYYIR